MKYLSFSLIVFVIQVVYGHYQGPFLLWGVENINDVKTPALQAIDDQNLRDIYTKAAAIVIFIRNATTKLSYENFPELSNIINKNEWLYLPQEFLSSDPLEYNNNAEVITLTGPPESQDNQIVEYFSKIDSKNILAILAESSDHHLSKREVTTDLPVVEPKNSFIYEAKGKCMLYTSSTPVLILTKNGISDRHELTQFTLVTADEKGDTVKLSVTFIVSENKIVIRFVFYISGGNWYLTNIQYGDDNKNINIAGSPVSAPVRWSYACGDSVTFKSENVSLTLKGIQVQPLLNGAIKFSKAYDCTGFMSAPILAGLFVSSILLFVLTIGITAMLDIKTPTRFENRHSKPLTFNVQE